MFVINKNTFENNFNLEKYGINLIFKKDRLIVDNLKWNGHAKKSGFEIDDVITQLKTENFDRPSKNIIYPIAFFLLIVFGYFNYRNKPSTAS